MLTKGETVNAFLNDNSQELFNEYKSDIFKQIGGMIQSVINEGLSNFPTDNFLKLIKQWIERAAVREKELLNQENKNSNTKII